MTKDLQTDKTQILTVMFDISARKQAEERITELAEQNRRILDSAGEGIVGINEDGRIIFSNPLAAQLLNRKVEEVLNQSFRTLTKPAAKNGKVILKRDDPFLRVLKDGRSRSINEVLLQRSDGSRFPAASVISPTHHEKGVSGAVITFRDISRRKEYERSLHQAKETAELANQENQRQKEYVQNIIDSLQHPFYVIDVNDYKIKLSNSATNATIGQDTCHLLTHNSPVPCDDDRNICPRSEVVRTRSR